MNSRNGLLERKGAEAVVAVFVLALLTAGAARAQDSGSDSSSSSSSSSGSSFGSSDSGGGSSFGSFGSSDSSGGFGSSTGTPSSTGTTSEKTAAELEAPNALRGLFTPQPQYPTPGTTIMNPETIPPHLGDDSKQPGRQPTGGGGTIYSNDFGKHETTEAETKNKDNPLKGLFQQQPQYPSPGKTIMFPEAVPKHVGDDSSVPGRQPGQAGTIYSNDWGKDTTEPSGNKDNVLKGLFVQQPQYPSPNKTIMYPDNTPKQLGDDSSQQGKQPGQAGTPYQPPKTPTLEEEAAAAAAAVLKVTPAAATKSSESEKKEGEGDKKDAEKKEGDKDKGDKKDGDKDGKKDGDKKDEEKDKDKKDTDKKDEKKDSILTGLDSDKEKKDGEEKKADDKKADADKDKDKKDAEKKEEKKEEKKLEPKAAEYHPIREAIILMNSRNYKASAEILDKLIAKNPGYAQAIYTRAVLNVMQRKYDQAVADYNAVLRITPVGGELRALAEKGLNKLHFQSPGTVK